MQKRKYDGIRESKFRWIDGRIEVVCIREGMAAREQAMAP